MTRPANPDTVNIFLLSYFMYRDKALDGFFKKLAFTFFLPDFIERMIQVRVRSQIILQNLDSDLDADCLGLSQGRL